MGLFARRSADDTVPATTSDGPPGSAPMPADFLVVSVAPGGDESVSLTGLVVNERSSRVGQVVVRLARPQWPEAGQALPALVDPEHPERFAVTWAVVAVVAGAKRTITASQWNDPEHAWDPGPDGIHEAALARWLSDRGHRPADLAAMDPELRARLVEHGWGG